MDNDFIAEIDVARAQYERNHKAALEAFEKIEFLQTRGASGWSKFCETREQARSAVRQTMPPPWATKRFKLRLEHGKRLAETAREHHTDLRQ